VIVKKRYSAFFGTDLDRVLAKLMPDAIILAGINTHGCIRMTAIDAYQRDWPVVLARDCVGSYDEEHHAVTLRYLHGKIAEVMTNDEIRAALPSLQG
jgi:isochorismate hydrolase